MSFNWKDPDYTDIQWARIEKLKWIRDGGEDRLKMIQEYYATDKGCADFIKDWGVTFDPRNADLDKPTSIPFVLFPKQEEFIAYVIDRWRARRPGLCEKSRDCGVSWVMVGFGIWMALYHKGVTIGYGSRKEIYVDKPGDPKSLFWKARYFMGHLPAEFQGGWVEWRDAPKMKLLIPNTGSLLTGEAGDNIGRGDRTTIYVVDEAAHLERPELVDQALSATTNCRIDVSSVKGMNSPFAAKRHGGKIVPFVFDWRDDPRKDQAWYDQQVHDLDPVTVAQEIDRDYSASVEGVVIPAAWVKSAIGAAEALGITPSGESRLALDVADEGKDKNAACGNTGIEIDFLEQWSGINSDVFATTSKVFEILDAERCYAGFRYDADGLGAGVRGDARILNEARRGTGASTYTVTPFQGSAAVFEPESIVEGTIGSNPGDKGRTNKDYFANAKAQAWWNLRAKFKRTYLWRVKHQPCDPDSIISLHPGLPMLHLLCTELSQPTYSQNLAGKIVVEKQPKGTKKTPGMSIKSPNLADALMINQAQMAMTMVVPDGLLNELRVAAMRSMVARNRGRRR